ncbi:MAG: TolC family protein [Myxococcales bacterium]|nr:TolC family protein [Myxococcales bacterium]MCB9651000.1 TolC family protein [Deltaproteobacteria bacterium]
MIPCISLALVAALPVRAEALDLETAVSLALEVHESPAIALAEAEQAKAQVRAAWSRMLPTVALSGTYRRRAFEVKPSLGDGSTATIQAKNALSAEASLETTLFDASAIPELQAARLRSRAQTLSAEETARSLAFETAEAFYAALAADRTLAAAERRLALAEATAENAQARFAAGLVGSGEKNRTQLDQAEAAQVQAEATRAARLARLALGFLVGATPAGELVAPKAPASAANGAERPDVAAARLLMQAAERATWTPWLSMVPSLALDASLRATNETGFQNRVFNWDIALTLTWVLYDGGARYAQVDLRNAQAEAARLAAQALSRQAELEVERAAAELQASLLIAEQAQTRARVAEENREEVEARFRQGLASALEETDAATAAFAASVGLEQARFEAAQAALSVARAAGGWPTPRRESPKP